MLRPSSVFKWVKQARHLRHATLLTKLLNSIIRASAQSAPWRNGRLLPALGSWRALGRVKWLIRAVQVRWISLAPHAAQFVAVVPTLVPSWGVEHVWSTTRHSGLRWMICAHSFCIFVIFPAPQTLPVVKGFKEMFCAKLTLNRSLFSCLTWVTSQRLHKHFRLLLNALLVINSTTTSRTTPTWTSLRLCGRQVHLAGFKWSWCLGLTQIVGLLRDTFATAAGECVLWEGGVKAGIRLICLIQELVPLLVKKTFPLDLIAHLFDLLSFRLLNFLLKLGALFLFFKASFFLRMLIKHLLRRFLLDDPLLESVFPIRVDSSDLSDLFLVHSLY